MQRVLSRVAFTAVCLLVASATVSAQMTVTGTITGIVADPSGQVVPGAKITITSATTGDVRTTTSNDVGAFSLVAVQPDTYILKVEHAGFKNYEQKGLVLTANEHLSVGNLALQIGAVSETISVEASAAQVQTESSEHSAVITANQLANLNTRGRDVVNLLHTIPGVQYGADADSVGGSYGSSTPNIGGMSANSNILAVDGVVSNDMGTPSVFSSVTTLDAIGEVKVILNSYQAEYAGNGGAVVQVVTRSGGKDFHGGGYWFVRNEDFNANDFFNNRSVSATYPTAFRGPNLYTAEIQPVQKGAVRLLQPRAAHGPHSGLAAAVHDAYGARAQRRLFANAGHERQADSGERPDDPRAFPRKRGPRRPARLQRTGAAEDPAAAQFRKPGDYWLQL